MIFKEAFLCMLSKKSVLFFILLYYLLNIPLPAPGNPDNMFNKVFCGYQGWFGADNDDPENDINWFHWCNLNTEPTPDTVTFDIWPDYSEYDKSKLFFSKDYDWRYKSGDRAGFFSSVTEETVRLHCRWLRDYGIDGVFVQRFIKRLSKSAEHLARMDKVLKYMLKWSDRYGLKVAVMYDITDMPITRISSVLLDDWVHLVRDLNITSHPSYQFHPDKTANIQPVVGIWGFGFLGEGVRGQARLIAGFFNNHNNRSFHATMVGGVPAFWRKEIRDSKPEYKEIYELFDVVSPWMVGRVRDTEDVENWAETIRKDIKRTSENGQDYMPVSFPGFSIYNLARNRLSNPSAFKRVTSIYGKSSPASEYSPLNKIPRNGGNFLWSQFHHWRKNGAEMIYIAMFDEVDESTAIFKLARREELETSPEIFLHLGIDGYELRNDHYLWMAGTVGFLIEQGITIPEGQPERFGRNSLSVTRNRLSGGELADGKVRIISTIKKYRNSYAELFRKTGNENSFVFLKRVRLINKEFTDIHYIDEETEPDKDYTYIIVVFHEDGTVRAVSDMKRTY